MTQQDNLTQPFPNDAPSQTVNVDRIRARINAKKQQRRQKRWAVLRNIGIFIAGVCVIAVLLAPERPVYTRLAEQGKAMVLARMKDPGSAQFRNLTIFHSDKVARKFVICGEVNARNSFNGYTGFTKFASLINVDAPTETSALLASDPGFYDVADKLCEMAKPM